MRGLDSGANDYVGKPFRFVVLLARIRAQLRQHKSSDDAEFRVGPYTFLPASKNLVDDQGVKLRLTEKEAAKLRYLHRAEQPVAREDLLKHVWGYNANVGDAYARDPHLSVAAENRGQSRRGSPPRDRGRRI